MPVSREGLYSTNAPFHLPRPAPDGEELTRKEFQLVATDGRAQEVRRSSLHYASFAYGVDGEIVRHTSRDREIKFKAIFLEDVEILREEFAPPLFPTPERTRVRNYIATPSGAVGFYEKTYLHFPMRQASPVYGDQIVDKPERTTAVATG